VTKIGILVHCRHLSTMAWEDLVSGIPERDELGDLATLTRVLLQLEPTERAECVVIGRGPSWKDGLDEGHYTKRFLLDNFDRLHEFPTLRHLFARVGREQVMALRATMENIIVTHEIKNTVHEIETAAKLFTERGIEKVVQISAASHAPRCIKEQAVARARGTIPKDQLWHTVATDMPYHGTKPEDVCVIEPLHRRDQPMTFVHPGAAEVLAGYFSLPDEDKKAFITLVDDFMTSRKSPHGKTAEAAGLCR
jgi:hypothetical protein